MKLTSFFLCQNCNKNKANAITWIQHFKITHGKPAPTLVILVVRLNWGNMENKKEKKRND